MKLLNVRGARPQGVLAPWALFEKIKKTGVGSGRPATASSAIRMIEQYSRQP